MKASLLIVLVGLTVIWAAGPTASAAVVGWQNNGRGDFPDAHPPATFYGEKWPPNAWPVSAQRPSLR